ncbi:MAG: TetR/AcrR family transcriptional regulator [Solirubrobacteraceae bacterium]|nr:TetR/AcrR family transcriptional regulator [Solirubrobacteraceae bacterium]
MPSPTRRRRPSQGRSRATVEALVEAAAQVFERHGYAAGTTNRIAERAGVSIGTLYQYFADKDALLVAVAEEHLRRGAAALVPLVATLADDPPPAPAAALGDLLRAMLALHVDRPRLHRLLFEEAPLPERIVDGVVALEAEFAGRVADWLRRSPSVTVDDADTTAWLLVQAIEGLVHRWVIHPPTAGDDERFVAATVALLTHGLGGAVRPAPRTTAGGGR